MQWCVAIREAFLSATIPMCRITAHCIRMKRHSIHIGKGVSIGHNAVVHGCTVGDNTVVGMGSIILSGAVVGKNCIIGAGALVTGKMVIPDNSMAFGNPAKVVRQLTEEEVEDNRHNAEHYVDLIFRKHTAQQ